MNIEKLVLQGAKTLMTAGEYTFKGAKVVCSTGHTVANGLRTTADAVDYISSVGERKTQEYADFCKFVKEDYKKKIIMIVQEEAAELASQGVKLDSNDMQDIIDSAIKKTQQMVEAKA